MSASVFPARAGMSRADRIAAAKKACVPRASGDEPKKSSTARVESECSPRERG